MNLSTDHTLRQVDIQVIDLAGTLPAEARGNTVCAGRLKIAQLYARALLTPEGHYKGAPGFGSEFLRGAQGMSNATTADVVNLFASSSLTVVEYIRSITPASTPEDERLVDARLIAIVPSSGRFSLAVELFFGDSGDAATYLFPVSGKALSLET